MNIKSVLLFIIFTVITHIILIKINEIILENNEMKQNKKQIVKKNKNTIRAQKEEKTENDENDTTVEIPAVSNNKISTEDAEIINDEDLRSDLLNFIQKSKENSSIISSGELSASKDNRKYEKEPGYLNFGEEIEKELKTTEYNLKTAGNNDNITLINATDNETRESTANKQFKMIQNAGWQYKNESIMNGGIDDGIGGFDPKAICNFAAL